jgi:hypothetical protein
VLVGIIGLRETQVSQKGYVRCSDDGGRVAEVRYIINSASLLKVYLPIITSQRSLTFFNGPSLYEHTVQSPRACSGLLATVRHVMREDSN